MTTILQDVSRLQAWLGAESRITGVAQPKTGFSADTMFLTLEDGRDLVVRIEHPDRAVFLDATIGRQARMMRLLGGYGVPAPAIVGHSTDMTILGAPFLVMERSAGAALPQHPSYHVAGLLTDLDETGRRRAWRQALETIARINRIEWRGAFDFLIEPSYGAPGLDHYLGWIAAWRVQALGEAHPVIDAALAHLVAARPRDAAVEMLWGDSNPGNFLFGEDGAVVAALDFEAASIGPAEIDISWWFFMDGMLAAGNTLPSGMPDREGQIAIYERALGRSIGDLAYYEILSALRMSLVMARIGNLLIAAGTLPTDNRVAAFNPAVDMLAGLIGMTPSGRMDDYMAMVRAMNAR